MLSELDFCLCPLAPAAWPRQSLSRLSQNLTESHTLGCVSGHQGLGSLRSNQPAVVRLSTCGHRQFRIALFFPSPQLAPTSSQGQLGKPDRHTALQWASQPNMLSSSTLLGQPATYPWTAGSVSEIYNLITWTHRTSVTLDISKWDWCKLDPPFLQGYKKEGLGREPVLTKLFLCARCFT